MKRLVTRVSKAACDVTCTCRELGHCPEGESEGEIEFFSRELNAANFSAVVSVGDLVGRVVLEMKREGEA